MKKIKIVVLIIGFILLVMPFTMLKDEDGNIFCIALAGFFFWLATPKGSKYLKNALEKED